MASSNFLGDLLTGVTDSVSAAATDALNQVAAAEVVDMKINKPEGQIDLDGDNDTGITVKFRGSGSAPKRPAPKKKTTKKSSS